MNLLSVFFGIGKKEPTFAKGADDEAVSNMLKYWKFAPFDMANFSRYDSGIWGYYFKYEVENTIVVGYKTISIDGEIKNITQALQDKILDFFESKGKGTIREEGIL